MSQTPQEQTTAQPNRRMTIVDFMTIGIFFVINMVVGVIIAFIGITPITYVMITPLQAIILGIPMMLFFSKVRKPGMLLVFEILTGLVSILLGLGPFVLVSGVIMALIGEFVLYTGGYTSAKRSVIAYALMSLTSTAAYIPLFFATESYLASDVKGRYGDDYLQGLTEIGHMSWVFAVIIVGTFLCGILGGVLGQRIFNKHFRRAGIV